MAYTYYKKRTPNLMYALYELQRDGKLNRRTFDELVTPYRYDQNIGNLFEPDGGLAGKIEELDKKWSGLKLLRPRMRDKAYNTEVGYFEEAFPRARGFRTRGIRKTDNFTTGVIKGALYGWGLALLASAIPLTYYASNSGPALPPEFEHFAEIVTERMVQVAALAGATWGTVRSLYNMALRRHTLLLARDFERLAQKYST